MRTLSLWRRSIVIAVLAAVQCPQQLAAQTMSSGPFLRVEPNFHAEMIWQIAADDSCSFIATASSDKTLRLWSAGTDGLKLQATVRVPIGAGYAGRLYAVAVSTNNELVATGGWDVRDTDHGVFLVDGVKGKVVSRLGGHAGIITSLAFAPDGNSLVVGMGGWGTAGVSLWRRASRTDQWAPAAEDLRYQGRAAALRFLGNDALLVVGDDGIRRYSSDLTLQSKSMFIGMRQPHSLSIDPTGSYAAIGFSGTDPVEIIDTRTLVTQRREGPSQQGLVAWAPDGRSIYVMSEAPDTRDQLLLWEASGNVQTLRRLALRNNVASVARCGDGLAIATAEPSFGVLKHTGETLYWESTDKFDPFTSSALDTFRASTDGRIVVFPSQNPAQPLTFQLDDESITSAAPTEKLFGPDSTSIPLSDWRYTQSPKIAGKLIPLESFEMSRAVATLPDKRYFVLGTDRNLRRMDLDAKVMWGTPTPSHVLALTIAQRAKLLLAMLGDGTVRWYRLDNGTEVLALYAEQTGERWAAWTPQGHYMASPGGEEMVPLGWHFNRSLDLAPDFFPVHLLRDYLYRPDILQRAIGAGEYKPSSNDPNVGQVLRQTPPTLDLVSPLATAFDSSEMSFQLGARSTSTKPIDHITIRYDGVFKKHIPMAPDALREGQLTLKLSLPPRDTTVTFIAYTGTQASLPVSASLKWTGTNASPPAKPRLRGLFIGVNASTEPANVLKTAVKDASELEAVLLAQKGKAYRDVDTRLVKDPTKADFEKGLKWLVDGAEDDDVSLIFFAGHGVTDEQRNFFLIASDSDFDKPAQTAASGATLIEQLRGLRGRVIALIDACHSADTFMARRNVTAPIDMSRFANDVAAPDNGVMIISASTARQFAFEGGEWGQNGAFTKALIDGLSGEADANGDGAIGTDELYAWVRKRVRAMTDSKQEPVKHQSYAVPDFTIARR